MAPNPWIYKNLNLLNGNVELILRKRDVRGGFDLGGFKEKKEVILKDIKYKNNDINYWKSIYNYIINYNENNCIIPRKHADFIIKQIKKYRYFARMQKKKIMNKNDVYKVILINRFLRKSIISKSLKNKFRLFIKINTILLSNLFDK